MKSSKMFMLFAGLLCLAGTFSNKTSSAASMSKVNSSRAELDEQSELTQEEISRRIIHLSEIESHNRTQNSPLLDTQLTNHQFKRDSTDDLTIPRHVNEDAPRVAALKLPRSNNRAQFFRGFNFLQNPTCSKCSRERNFCQIVSGIFTRTPLPYGYSLVTQIPAGICNVTIVEIRPSKNFFALRRKDNSYVLNGNWKIQASGSYVIAGTIFTYTPSDGVIGEKLQAIGPLREAIDLMLIYQSANPGIRYEYRIPFAANAPAQSTRPFNTPASSSASTNSGYRPENTANARTDPVTPAVNGFHPNPKDGSTGRYNSYSGLQSSISGIPAYPQRPNIGYGGPLANKWGSFYTPATTKHPAQANPIPAATGTGKRFKGRFPEILNNDPDSISAKSVKVYNFQEIPSVQSSGNLSRDLSNPIVSGHSPHRIRHQHGQRNIFIGPAVGGQRNYLSGTDETFRKVTKAGPNLFEFNGIANDEHNKQTSKKKRKKKRGRRKKDRYHWVFKGLTKCSRTCGGGNQTSVLSCEKKRKNKVVSDRRCVDVPKPEIKVVSCNLKPCPAEWVPGEWESCSATCGNGTQKRPLLCKQEVSPTLTMMVHEGACQTTSTHKTLRGCNTKRCPTQEPYWKLGLWSDCSASCGNGTRTRQVQCIVWLSEEDSHVCEKAELPKPSHIESCSAGTCALNTWHFTEWSTECLGQCGNKKETRSVFCMTEGEHTDGRCASDDKPHTSRSCEEQPGCTGIWFTGAWSECSVGCGVGHESRPVECLSMRDGRWRPVPYKECSKKDKPADARECSRKKCAPKWYITEWSECSALCNGGLQSRETKCLTTQADVSVDCVPSLKPPDTNVCNQNPCEPQILTTHNNSGTFPSEPDLLETSLKDPPSSEEDHEDPYEEEMAEDRLYEDMEDVQLNGSHNEDLDDKNDQSNALIVDTIEDNHINDDPNKYQEVPLTKQISADEERKHKSAKDSKVAQTKQSCIDRIKNCHLVFRARLCRLKYYNKLCCATCKQ